MLSLSQPCVNGGGVEQTRNNGYMPCVPTIGPNEYLVAGQAGSGVWVETDGDWAVVRLSDGWLMCYGDGMCDWRGEGDLGKGEIVPGVECVVIDYDEDCGEMVVVLRGGLGAVMKWVFGKNSEGERKVEMRDGLMMRW